MAKPRSPTLRQLDKRNLPDNSIQFKCHWLKKPSLTRFKTKFQTQLENFILLYFTI